MSLTVISPTQRYCSSTTISFSIRCLCSRERASSGCTSAVTVIRFSRVINSYTRRLGSVAKRTSRWVIMPTKRLVSRSTTGKPEIRCIDISALRSARVWSGWMVSGFTTMPDSNFLTLRTCAACSSGVRFLWITPIPPSCAMMMHISASVTVSSAAEINGILREIVRVTRVRVSVDDGSTCEYAGTTSTSSNASASMTRSASRLE